MINAIKTILSGQIYYCSEVAVKLIESEKENYLKQKAVKRILTKRETEVLTMIAEEMTNIEIAQKLNVDKRTIDTHRENLMNKPDVKNTAGLVKAAFRLKLIEQ